MLNKEITDFTYHEFKTDSDNIVKDLSRIMALGAFSKEVVIDGSVVKKSVPSIEYNWQIVNPTPNFDLINRDVKGFEDLTQEEYSVITEDQLFRVTNKVVLKCTTTSETDMIIDNIKNNKNNTCAKYLQIYMPKYLCDTEVEDPFAQERSTADIPKCINPKTGAKDAIIRNYHWLLMRVFDIPNEDFSGPLENDRDLITGEFLTFNSASSEWSKLSWFTDFEEMFQSEVGAVQKASGKDPIVRVPVSSSLTNKTKIKVMANVHPNRMVFSVVGNPNVDYSDNRYLISMAYIGAIDSFKGSKKDVEGNFGIFTTSSSVPSIPASSYESVGTFSGLDKDPDGSPYGSGEKWKVYDQKPPKVEIKNSPETDVSAFIDIGMLQDLNVGSVNQTTNVLPGEYTIMYNYKKRQVPADPISNSEGGRTSIDANSIRTTIGCITGTELNFTFIYEYGNDSIGSHNNKHVSVNIPVGDLSSSKLPIKSKLITKEGSLTENIEIKIKNDDLLKYLYKYIEAELAVIGDQHALTPGAYSVQRVRFSGRKYITWNSSMTINDNKVLLGFNEQGVVKRVVNKTERDSYGNLLLVNYPKTFGKHTANGSTDFAMYKTDSADFWQSHFLMFSSTEQFMQKHMYGKSAYTGEYFADRIKVTHSSEGVRGVMSGMIVIDADSLFAFDELIVNKDYEKDADKPEETYVYIPITSPYCPFSNSPNERNGVGLLKEIKKNDNTDEAKCENALDRISEMYLDSLYFTNEQSEIVLVDEVDGLSITWESDTKSIINTDSPVSEE